MRCAPILILALCSSCTTSPEAPLSNAIFSAEATVHSSRAQPSFVSYGAPYHRWTITFATVEGCGGDAIASVELTTLASATEVPLGVVQVRTVETSPAPLPSAYVRYQAAPVLSGTVTIDTADVTFISGSVAAQLMIGGTPTDITATFGSPICPE